MQEHLCEVCGAKLQTRLALQGHQWVYHADHPVGVMQRPRTGPPVVFRCGFCDKSYGRHQQLQDHLERRHKSEREERAREIAERVALSGRRPRRGRRRAPTTEAA
jgi:hypothetical protein